MDGFAVRRAALDEAKEWIRADTRLSPDDLKTLFRVADAFAEWLTRGSAEKCVCRVSTDLGGRSGNCTVCHHFEHAPGQCTGTP